MKTKMIHSAIATGLLLVVIGCSTIKSSPYMKPHANGLTRLRNQWGPLGRLRLAGATVDIGVVQMGAYRAAIGPCIFPILPGRKQWPRPLTIAITSRHQGNVSIYPGRWTVRTREKEFGKTFFAADIFKTHRAFRAFAGARMRIAWQSKGGQALQLKSGEPTYIRLPVYDNQFVDFVLSGVVLDVDGKPQPLPAIRFTRHSNWTYTWFDVGPMLPRAH